MGSKGPTVDAKARAGPRARQTRHARNDSSPARSAAYACTCAHSMTCHDVKGETWLRSSRAPGSSKLIATTRVRFLEVECAIAGLGMRAVQERVRAERREVQTDDHRAPRRRLDATVFLDRTRS